MLPKCFRHKACLLTILSMTINSCQWFTCNFNVFKATISFSRLLLRANSFCYTTIEMLEASIARRIPAGSPGSKQHESCFPPWLAMSSREARICPASTKHLLHGRTVNYRGTSEQAQVKHITVLQIKFTNTISNQCVYRVCACIGKCDQARFQPYPSSKIPIQNEAH